MTKLSPSNRDLDKVKNKSVLSAPDGYFDALTERLHLRIHDKPRQQQVYFPTLKLAGRAAAILLVLVGFAWLYDIGIKRDMVSTVDLSKISDEDILSYLESHPQFDVEFWDQWEFSLQVKEGGDATPDLDIPLEEIMDWLDSSEEKG
jgi:hypothetical protein